MLFMHCFFYKDEIKYCWESDFVDDNFAVTVLKMFQKVTFPLKGAL